MSSLIHQTMLIVILISLASAYFEIDVQRMEQLDDKKYYDITHMRLRKDKESKTRKFYGNMSIHKELDNSFTETVVAYVKQGGEYRKMPYKIAEKGICDFNKDDKYFYPELTEHSDWPLPFPCPITPRVIEFRGFQPSLKNVPNTIMPTGDYAADVMIKKDDEVVVHLKVFISLIRL